MKKLKDLSPTTKVSMKNWYLFRLYLHRKEGFVETLRELLLKWRPNIESISHGELIREEMDYKTLQKMKEMKDEAAQKTEAFEENLSAQKKQELTDDIDNFRRRFGMGREWFLRIKLLLITGFWSPPKYEFRNIHR